MRVFLFVIFSVSIFDVRVFAGDKKNSRQPIVRLHDCYNYNGELVLISNSNSDSASACASVKGQNLTSSNPKIIQQTDPSKCVLVAGTSKDMEFKGNKIFYSELEYYCGEEHKDRRFKVTCKGNFTTDLLGCLKAKFDLKSWQADVLKSKKATRTQNATSETVSPNAKK